MMFKVKLILLSLIVGAVLPSVITLQQVKTKATQAGPGRTTKHTCLLCGCISLHCKG